MAFPDKTIVISDKTVEVCSEKISGNFYKLTASLSGKTSEHYLTIGVASGGEVAIPTLEEMQAAVDAARQTVAAHVVLHDALEALEGQIT